SVQHKQAKRQVVVGGGWNRYDGNHYGLLPWAHQQVAVPVNYRYYDNDAVKKDLSIYTKWTEQLSARWQTFVDLQGRAVDYRINGFRNNPAVNIDERYFFFNPKAGLTWSYKKTQAYLSYGRATKEPNRDDFETGASQIAKPEKLDDFEAGLDVKTNNYSWGINLYFMNYKDQLVLTGKINDVGAYTRTNIPQSYRAGIEITGGAQITKRLSASANLTLSKNKVKNFTEYIDDYDNGGQQTNFYEEADIAFSPAVVGAYSINFLPFKKAEINLMGKYVSKQYLDNTSQISRSLKSFYVQDVKLNYQLKEARLFLQVNNVFSKLYEPNGYTFSYIYGGEQTTENFYFPMSPVYFTGGVNIKL
ncbi:MAG: TonB-dependent receptor, partial [Chitinophagaceae bacterium]